MSLIFLLDRTRGKSAKIVVARETFDNQTFDRSTTRSSVDIEPRKNLFWIYRLRDSDSSVLVISSDLDGFLRFATDLRYLRRQNRGEFLRSGDSYYSEKQVSQIGALFGGHH